MINQASSEEASQAGPPQLEMESNHVEGSEHKIS